MISNRFGRTNGPYMGEAYDETKPTNSSPILTRKVSVDGQCAGLFLLKISKVDF